MELTELLALITFAWPSRYQRGRITQLYHPDYLDARGAVVKVSVTLQTLKEAPLAAKETA